MEGANVAGAGGAFHGFRHKEYLQAAVLLADFGYACGSGVGAQQGNIQQRLRRSRQVAEPIQQFILQIHIIGLVGDHGNAPIQIHTGGSIFHVLLGQAGRNQNVGGAIGALCRRFPLQLAGGLLQKLQIHVVSHVHHMAALLGTQHIAGAADLQVAHGDLETRAKLSKLADGGQPLLRHFAEGLAPAIGKIGVGVTAASAHTAADLVQLRQAHIIGIFDDERVHIGNVHTGLDDGGAHQNRNLAGVHAAHYIAHGFFAHPPVGNCYHGFREEILQLFGHAADGINAVMQVIYLAAPIQLPADGIPNDAVIVLQYIGLYRLTPHGRFFQHAHVPNAGECHV